jgi:hypothetical protein
MKAFSIGQTKKGPILGSGFCVGFIIRWPLDRLNR